MKFIFGLLTNYTGKCSILQEITNEALNPFGIYLSIAYFRMQQT